MKKKQKYSKYIYLFSRAGVISVNNSNNCGNNEVENAIYLQSFWTKYRNKADVRRINCGSKKLNEILMTKVPHLKMITTNCY